MHVGVGDNISCEEMCDGTPKIFQLNNKLSGFKQGCKLSKQQQEKSFRMFCKQKNI